MDWEIFKYQKGISGFRYCIMRGKRKGTEVELTAAGSEQFRPFHGSMHNPQDDNLTLVFRIGDDKR